MSNVSRRRDPAPSHETLDNAALTTITTARTVVSQRSFDNIVGALNRVAPSGLPVKAEYKEPVKDAVSSLMLTLRNQGELDKAETLRGLRPR